MMKPVRESKVVYANIQQKQAVITCNSLSTYSKVLCNTFFFSINFKNCSFAKIQQIVK